LNDSTATNGFPALSVIAKSCTVMPVSRLPESRPIVALP
jgi:hypothetical protein